MAEKDWGKALCCTTDIQKHYDLGLACRQRDLTRTPGPATV